MTTEITPKLHKRAPAFYAERNARWAAAFRAGETMQAIADRDGFTRSYVHRVFKRMGVKASEGGHAIGGGIQHVRIKAKADREAAKRSAMEARQADRERITGLPVGVYYHKSSGLYSAFYRSRKLPGYHKTISSARSARESAVRGIVPDLPKP